jgi:hypothetical protein
MEPAGAGMDCPTPQMCDTVASLDELQAAPPQIHALCPDLGEAVPVMSMREI